MPLPTEYIYLTLDSLGSLGCLVSTNLNDLEEEHSQSHPLWHCPEATVRLYHGHLRTVNSTCMLSRSQEVVYFEVKDQGDDNGTRKAHINWNILAANLIHRSPSYPAADLASNLYFRFRPTQGQEIGSFIESFVRTLGKHTEAERRKYPDRHSPFAPDELVLDDRVAEQICTLAHRWCKAYKWPLSEKIHKTEGLCRHVDSEGFACGCPLPYHERKGAAFQRRYRRNKLQILCRKHRGVL